MSTEHPTAPTAANKPQGSPLWENGKVVLQALVIAMVIRSFFVQPFDIPSSSMMPTLRSGDYIFVDKFSYGYSRFSFPFSLPLFSGRIFARAPKRGDVVVFRLPRDPDINYVKRLIGLPGDRVQMIDGRLYINGEPVAAQPDGIFNADDIDDMSQDVPVIRETLDDGRTYKTLNESDLSAGDNTRAFVVPVGEYFMMGDNRDNSADSRFDVGFVPADNLVGRASFVAFSHRGALDWYRPWSWPRHVRWSRLLSAIR